MSSAVVRPLATLATPSTNELLQTLLSQTTGLTAAAAAARLHQDGLNTFNVQRHNPWWMMLLRDFANPLILVLFAISGVSYFLHDYVNAGIVLTMIGLSVLLNFFQEYRASQAAAKLQSRLALTCTVLRDNQAITLPATQLCRGDIMILNAGDLISADARLLTAKDFFVNQAALTGESFPVEKLPSILPANTDLNGLTNMVLSGTSVVTGSATALVVHTGLHSEYGQIAQSVARADTDNEFTLGIKNFSTFLLRIIFAFVVFVFAVNWILKHDFLSSLSFAVAVAVGLTPEFLPMILSVTMSRGSLIMAKKGVIVKKLTAIPSFGSMNVLCTDKTGTLTLDHIQVVKYVDCSGEHSEDVLLHAYLCSIFHTGVANPLDEAIKNYKQIPIADYRKIDEVPFDYERKRMSVVVEHDNQHWLITKGAPEEVLTIAGAIHHGQQVVPLDAASTQHFKEQYEQFSQEGYRVLAVARRVITVNQTAYSKTDEHDMEILGLVAFLDPVRPQVKATLEQLEQHGIEIKVITGDNELVTQKICRDAGVPIKGILLGHELANYSEDALTQKCKDTTIFARFSPQQKERVIHHLKEGGMVVGYLGDGINDAPSLLTADVGISVENAVDVAKESADMILTTKDLQQLIDGVVEGRKIFANTMKYLMMGMSSNFGNMFSVLIGVFFLPFLPMLPIQILLNNFLYDLSQIAIPTDNVDPELVLRPRRWDINFIKRFMYVFGPISSIFDIITYIMMLAVFHASAPLFQTGWFMESLATQTLVIFAIRTRRVPFLRSRPSLLIAISAVLIVALGWLIPLSPLRHLFAFGRPNVPLVVALIAIVGVYMVLVEIGKTIFYRWLVKEA